MKNSDKTQALQVQVTEALEKKGMSQKKLAKEIGISTASLSQWISGKYPTSVARIEAKISTWILGRETRERMGKLPECAAWVATPTGQDIYDILEFAYCYGKQALVYGSPGMGKTVTCEEFQRTHSGVWLLTPTSVTGTKKGILTLLADALHITPGRALADTQTACIERMSDTGGMIIIDEAQQLPPNSLDLMRQVAEAAEVGLAFVGNEGVYTQMVGGSRAGKFGQILSRARTRHIALPHVDDVVAICMAMGISDNDTAQFLFDISQTPGALRLVAGTIQIAAVEQGGNEISLPAVKAAFFELTGIRVGGRR
ncbi:MAG: AAA family ATPase [Pontiellaceae bacterium]|nr:AAA family ATPase [Pontiellaceae bacterium]